MIIDEQISASDLLPLIDRMWELSAQKILTIEESDTLNGQTPVFTVEGKYQPQGWTEWTQGFQFGSAILQFDATGDERFLEIGRRNTIEKMAPHVSHIGVHDHGFNNVSTYGNLRRLMLEGRIPHDERELQLYETALKVSGAVQASRWSTTIDGDGYVYSFNGPHSLFCDTIRSMIMNFDNVHQVEELLEKQLDSLLEEKLHGSHALQNMADALPALGIVAAVLGVIKTMSSIDKPPEILGGMIGGALVGTFLGVFLAYGIVGPFAARVKHIRVEEHNFYSMIGEVLVSNLHKNPVNICVEVARRHAPTRVRPSFNEVEEAIRGLKQVA